jgi:hypothetical protein
MTTTPRSRPLGSRVRRLVFGALAGTGLFGLGALGTIDAGAQTVGTASFQITGGPIAGRYALPSFDCSAYTIPTDTYTGVTGSGTGFFGGGTNGSLVLQLGLMTGYDGAGVYGHIGAIAPYGTAPVDIMVSGSAVDALAEDDTGTLLPPTASASGGTIQPSLVYQEGQLTVEQVVTQGKSIYLYRGTFEGNLFNLSGNRFDVPVGHISGSWSCAMSAASPTPRAKSSGSPSTAPPPSSRSLFGTSLPLLAGSELTLSSLLINALLAIIFGVLVVFPAELFNRVYEENHERITRWWSRWLPTRMRAAALTARHQRRVNAAPIVVLVVGSLLAALLDPGFGANTRTVALALGAAFAIVVCTSGGGLAVAFFRRLRGHPVQWGVRALPGALAVTAIGVLVSRVTNFEPGYLYGIIIGIAFSQDLPRREEGQAVAASATAALAISVGAWLLWNLIEGTTNGRSGSSGFGISFLEDFLTSVFVTGLVGVVFGLVPLRFLPGAKLVGWHWAPWALAFCGSLFVLLEVLVRPQTSHWYRSPPFWTTLGLFVSFGVASLVFWAYFRVRTEVATAPAG